MKRISMKPAIMLFALALAIFLNSCTTEDTPIPNAPDIPPASSLVMNFDNDVFGSGKIHGTEGDNLNFAAVNVAIWQTILTIQMAVPVAAFVHSFNQDWDYNDGKWQWEYDYNFGLVKHTARLEANIIGDNVHWAMFISKNGHYSDFLWFTGVSALDGTMGSWALNADPDNPAAFLAIDWTNSGNGNHSIRYSNAIGGSPDFGSYIEYIHTTDSDFNAHFTIYGAAEDNLLEILWNEDTNAGQIKAPYHFGDESWHCWNELLEDIDC